MAEFTSIINTSVEDLRKKIVEMLKNSRLTYNEILMNFGYTVTPKPETHQKLGTILQTLKGEGLIGSEFTPSLKYHSMLVNRYFAIE